MTTIPERHTTGTLQENPRKSVSCSKTIDLEIFQKPSLLSSCTTRTVGVNDKAVAFTVTTRKDRIAVPLDVNWEIQRAKNLIANNVHLAVETTHEENVSTEAICQYPIE
ncbi:hypothetical protein [Desulfomonile tiedjei]|uniref:Uncharacterized protein n=1 Tax=Desulfomonile tiedjei (strain ATCC 49306 / DSM 6799 / DCB-1) TaxID=706587 RepID=I4CCG6_DESTA|nr:hypothetical protein [Desulfomonile tiedjei]AFM27257.1 hypothetical protein Desti_4633 [Desulfomonile tiedjei DSM 6799]